MTVIWKLVMRGNLYFWIPSFCIPTCFIIWVGNYNSITKCRIHGFSYTDKKKVKSLCLITMLWRYMGKQRHSSTHFQPQHPFTLSNQVYKKLGRPQSLSECSTKEERPCHELNHNCPAPPPSPNFVWLYLTFTIFKIFTSQTILGYVYNKL